MTTRVFLKVYSIPATHLISFFSLSFWLEKISQRYGNLSGELHMIELEKGKTGLGLSLAGNKDRSKMSVFVVGIDPNGAAGKDGRLQIADELLEVSVL